MTSLLLNTILIQILPYTIDASFAVEAAFLFDTTPRWLLVPHPAIFRQLLTVRFVFNASWFVSNQFAMSKVTLSSSCNVVSCLKSTDCNSLVLLEVRISQQSH